MFFRSELPQLTRATVVYNILLQHHFRIFSRPVVRHLSMSNSTIIYDAGAPHPALRVLEALLNPTPLGFLISVIVVLTVPILIHQYLASSSGVTTLPSILVVGPLGSGKTSLQTLASCALRHSNWRIANSTAAGMWQDCPHSYIPSTSHR